jgi:threonine/homoserine/homoserine lactone efflux protein
VIGGSADLIPLADLAPILLGWAVVVASPGPAILAIVGAAMGSGRVTALAVSVGVWFGSLLWAVIAALGLGAAMLAHVWIFEVLKYAGAAYLLYLAYKSARNAISGTQSKFSARNESLGRAWRRGFTLHVMNPKAVLFWGSLFAVVVPVDATPIAILQVGASCLMVSLSVMCILAIAFSMRVVASAYLRLRAWFEGAFALFFGYAALQVVSSKIV